jgi:hypothetical protein
LRWIESRVFTWYSPMYPPTATIVTSTLRRIECVRNGTMKL